jgi:hypothetical protein
LIFLLFVFFLLVGHSGTVFRVFAVVDYRLFDVLAMVVVGILWVLVTPYKVALFVSNHEFAMVERLKRAL